MEEPASIVACLGSSSTAGKGQAFNWVGELQNRLSGRFTFHNFGVGGDLSYNALQRLASVLTIRPDRLVVLIGGNDALAMVFPKARSYYHFAKRLPRAPTIDWFAQNIREIVRRSKGETKSAIRNEHGLDNYEITLTRLDLAVRPSVSRQLARDCENAFSGPSVNRT